MVYIYDECRKVMRQTVRLCTERFLDRVRRLRFVFSSVIEIFHESKSVGNRRRNKRLMIEAL